MGPAHTILNKLLQECCCGASSAGWLPCLRLAVAKVGHWAFDICKIVRMQGHAP